MSQPLEPLDPELARLLDTERAATPPNAALDRVWSRLAAVPAPVGHAAGAHVAPVAKATAWTATHVAVVGVAAFVVGGVVAGSSVLALRKPAERIVYVERTAPPSSPPPMATPPPRVVPIVTPTPLASVASAPSTAPMPASTLSSERAVLDAARAALISGDAARALALLDEHAHRFRKAQLGEEREALAVQALVVAGRYDAARARAARFKAGAPASMFIPAVDATLGSIP
jgi:hypothetical protein